ncbi:electron transfer flavoprotein subunit alpha/FixB family protein [Sporomusa sp.]|uniref:electron transfer flavoprotein subunit alpha/FixB family protein n=1 Tax=Sporomusa sp. TaxID=2078658 RepID=UPI002CA142B2|nr:electron transfer flavoprotein subunit alpha/FixB family protein [Sporomusa sp.]HWR05742.1 electron transfer flavoprotein subunit alpha/FixB family protein [Sporomusa sp.]
MAGIYIYSDKTELVAELIGFARESGKAAYVITFDQQAAAAAAVYGPDQVYLFQGNSPLVENYAKVIARFLSREGAELLVVGATARGRDIAARIAGYLECGMVSDVASLVWENGKLHSERMLYGGAVTQSEIATDLVVITVPAGKFEPAKAGSSEITVLDVEADPRVVLTGTSPVSKAGVDLSVADKVICIGVSMEKKEDMQMVWDLGQALGAELGCTRAIAEQRQWLPNYIGISGITIKPSLYVAVGVSGQVQHTVGVRDSRIIVAINSNEKAPIFQAADYGIVGDMYEIVPLLTQEINSTKSR